MTDLISSLAESIVALINSKPQSPTKDEVDAVVREHVDRSTLRIKADAAILASHPVMHIAPGHVVVWSAQNDLTDWAPDPFAGDMPIDADLLKRLAHRTGPTFTCDRYGHRVSKQIDVCGKCSCGATKP